MDLFGNTTEHRRAHVNIYADESIKRCPHSGNIWNYIGIIIEDLEFPLLSDIINERYMGNFDEESKYFKKNNKIIHWSDLRTADAKNICERWFKYVLNPVKSKNSFYSYILGLNESLLNKNEFNVEDKYNSIYNRFFRSVVLYTLKKYFGGKVVVENIFHEQGPQFNSEYFPWHTIYKLKRNKDIEFNCSEIIQLPKDHKTDSRSNIIQLCDVIMGVSTSIIHGINENRNSEHRKILAKLYAPLLKRLINNPNNVNSSYKYYKRIGLSFFPKEKTELYDLKRMKNQFYNNRRLKFIEDKSNQIELF